MRIFSTEAFRCYSEKKFSVNRSITEDNEQSEQEDKLNSSKQLAELERISTENAMLHQVSNRLQNENNTLHQNVKSLKESLEYFEKLLSDEKTEKQKVEEKLKESQNAMEKLQKQ